MRAAPMTEPAELRTRDIVVAIAVAAVWVALVRPGPVELPYFWDEGDVYVPGAKWLAENGFDIRPGVFAEDYARGHPPLFYLVAAIVFAAFGAGPAVGHTVILPFTVLAIAGTYWLGAALFGRAAGVAAAGVLAATPLVLSIGNMLLPETAMVAGTALAFFALARGRLGVAVAVACAVVLVKETGIFTGGALGVAVLVDAWRKGRLRTRETLARAALAGVPLVVLGAFYAWQKLSAGYVLYPMHAGFLTDRPLDATSALTALPSLFVWHGRAILCAGGALALLLGGRPALHALSTELRASGAREPLRREAVLVGLVALIVFNAAFFAKVFWLPRYALPAHVGVVVLFAGCLAVGLERVVGPGRERSALALGAIVAMSAMTLGLQGLWTPAPADAEELTFAWADVTATHRAAYDHLDPSARAPVATTWPLTVELETPYLGYVDRPVRSVHARRLAREPDLPLSAVVVNEGSTRAGELREAARVRGFRRAAVEQVGLAPSVEVWLPERVE